MVIERFRPHVEVNIRTKCQSSRNGATIKLITVHDTEGLNVHGLADLSSLGHYWDTTYGTPRASSSHVATDAEGHSARFVADASKAWHCAYYNSVSLGIEQIGRASQSKWPSAQLEETARWIAYWCNRHNIRCYKGQVSSDGKVLRTGIVRHSDLGNLGGGHVDPGAGYPLSEVLILARKYLTLY